MGGETETDFLVVGSGGGGMVAALTAHHLGMDTLLLEQSSVYGGTTAMSGGGIWVPNNGPMREAGLADSELEADEYLNRCVGSHVPGAVLLAYAKQAPAMIEFLRESANVRFASCTQYPDYYPELPGGKPGGRTLECEPMNGAKLGAEEFRNLMPPHPQELVFGALSFTAREARELVCGGWKGYRPVLEQGLRYLLNPVWRKKYGRSRRLTLGNSLIGQLRLNMMDRNVPLWLDTRVTDLVVEEGRVRGVVAERDGTEITVHASRGVLLAAGGFAMREELRQRWQPDPARTDWTAASREDRGSAITLGGGVNAQVARTTHNWWTPTMLVPGEELPWLLVVEKGLPYSLVVNGNGERFVNEAAPYIDFVRAMYEDHATTGKTVPAYFIFDRNYRKRYPCGPVMPSSAQPDRFVPSGLWNSFLFKADSIGDLADKLGIDSDRLRNSIAGFNVYAKAGRDDDFGRGESLYDRYYADERVGANPCLGPVARPPYYAVKVWPGDLGTKGGLVTDEYARVVDESGNVVEGLYAAGNSAASVMGDSYPGAGATIGPSMTFGYVAAHHAADGK